MDKFEYCQDFEVENLPHGRNSGRFADSHVKIRILLLRGLIVSAMAPFRGSRGRGGRGRGGLGGRGGRGGSTRGSGKLARSGIRTKAGYRRFDSQRVKEVERAESGDGEADENVVEEEDDDVSEDEDVETAPAVKPYNVLLHSFQPPEEENGRKRKRRKVEVEEEVADVIEDDGSDGGAGVEVADDDEDAKVEEKSANGDGGQPEQDDDEDVSDPFQPQFANPDDNELARRLKHIQANEWRTEKQNFPNLGSITVSAPKNVEGNLIRKPIIKSANDLPLKQRLAASAQERIGSLDNLQQAIVSYTSTYTDLLLGNRTPQNANSLRNLACLHALNHVLKGRDRVLKNNTRLAHDDTLDLRDQGFTRPKVLILLETRQVCFKYAEAIVSIFAPEQQENKQRFTDSFAAPIDANSSMPEDYQELFEGNTSNNFLTALKLTRKTLKFYSPFYTSDIVLASPLGLRRIIENEDVKKRDHDFLSSIELVIVDQADAMQMQNWENVTAVFKHLNLQLKEDAHGCDFSRVRNWYLEGNAKFLRQTIVFGAYITPEMNRLFNTDMLNVAGKAKLMPSYDSGAIDNLGGSIKQTFSRFSSASPSDDPDARFKYFTTAVLPSLLRTAQGTLIFIPTYFDFLRIRNYFATSTQTQNLSFGSIHEYADTSAQRRARSHFLSGRHSVLLYTQRAHHFWRLRIRGVKRVVCYGVPDDGRFYEEVVGGFFGGGDLSGEAGEARVLFSRWDGLALERVVGRGRLGAMLGGRGDRFEFV